MHTTAPVRFGYDGGAMKLPPLHRIVSSGVAALAFPLAAHAHSGDPTVHGFTSGCAHPLLGGDHLLALAGVGVWAAQLGGRARWAMPAAFVGAMACGAALGAGGFTPPLVEPMIFVSVLVLGLLVATAARLPFAAGATLVAGFALFHGLAHGAELPVTANPAPYVAGIFTTTVALLLGGLGLGRAAQNISATLPRAFGALCAAAGLALLFS